jgi:hypothetical protein
MQTSAGLERKTPAVFGPRADFCYIGNRQNGQYWESFYLADDADGAGAFRNSLQEVDCTPSVRHGN